MYPRDTHAEIRQRLGLLATETLISFVATDVWAPGKGFADLAKAFTKLAPEIPKLNLLVIGNGERGSLGSLIEEREIRRRVHMVGTVQSKDEISRWLSAVDLHVVPSYQDTFNLTAAEAMACGTPVLAYDTGGIPEVVAPGESGLLISGRGAETLRGSLPEALRWACVAGRRVVARRTAVARFSTSTFIAKHEALYLDLAYRGERSESSCRSQQ
jgi:glycosyltransferase involved in cell wall biosynthesis